MTVVEKPGATAWPPELTRELLSRKVAEALDEDLGPARRDLTSEAVVDPGQYADAVLIAQSEGVLAGMALAEEVFRQLDPAEAMTALVADGMAVAPGQTIARLRGSLRTLLQGERTALNFLQQLSGVATLTRRCVDAATGAGRAPLILDTRKTVPGLRALQRYAVLAGGGSNHRYNLATAVLVKDNHLAAAGGVAAAATAARATGLAVEVEVAGLPELEEALAAGADLILLDNLGPQEVAAAVALVAGRVPVEVSGGVGLHNVAEYAATGVDRISIGSLTHSAPALDISMEVRRTWRM